MIAWQGLIKVTPFDMPLSLSFPASPARRRPPDLLYAADDKLPWGALAVLAAQHAATAMAFLSYVLVTAKIAHLDASGTQAMLTMTLIGMAITSGLQAWGGRFGSGLLLVHVPNPFVISFVAAIVAAYGPGAMIMVALVYGGVTLAVAPLVSRMRPLFPPTVLGAVIVMGGLSLVESAVRHSLGLNAQWQINIYSVLISAATLAVIVTLSIWGGRRLGLMALLLGILVGVGLAAALGQIADLQPLRDAALLALPSVPMPVFKADVVSLVALGLIAVLTQLDTLGNVSMMDKMEDADWKRVNMRAVAGGIRANGIGDLVAGVLGGFPTCSSSTNIALAHATHSTARWVGLATAAILAVAAFMPKVTVSLMLIPAPVLGAIELYAASFLIVAGFELVASRAMDSRATFSVGLAICAGLSIMLMPEMMQAIPAQWRTLFGNGFVVAGLLVIGLNMLFRLGTARSAQKTLNAQSADLHQEITSFVEMRGAAWGARRNVVQRAAMAALEAAEVIAASGGRELQAIRGSFDEFNFDLELLHSGAPLQLTHKPVAGVAAVDLAGLLDADDDALDNALAQVSGLLLRHLADRVRVVEGGGSAAGSAPAALSALQLHFEH